MPQQVLASLLRGGFGTVAAPSGGPPAITSDGGGPTTTKSVPENSTAVTTVAATDPNSLPITFSISGGADSALFAIDATSGDLTFSSAPDYEAPGDADANNIYVVTVRASNGTAYAEQTISVNVTNINEAATSIAWAGSHSVPEDAGLGTVVGGILTASDPDVGDTGAFTIIDSEHNFDLFGTNEVMVVGVLDFETNPSPTITIRWTDAGGLTYDQAFTVTVTDVVETVGDPPPSGSGADDGAFDVPPTIVSVNDGVKTKGKKGTGSSGKFLYDIGAPAAGYIYTYRYTADFSLLANGGETAFVGFGLKQSNDFHLVGLKGASGGGSPSFLEAHEIYGTNFAATTGQTDVNVGAAHYGSPGGNPNWIQLEVSDDGLVYSFRTSPNGTDWVDEVSYKVPNPKTSVTAFTSFGLAVYLELADSGYFSIKFEGWDAVPKPDKLLLSGDMQTSGYDGLLFTGDTIGRLLLGTTSETPAAATWMTQAYAEVMLLRPSSLRVTQAYAEVWRVGASKIRVSQNYAEVMKVDPSSVRISQNYAEVVKAIASAGARISQVYVEVIHS